jgi:hypothetical protein
MIYDLNFIFTYIITNFVKALCLVRDFERH